MTELVTVGLVPFGFVFVGEVVVFGQLGWFGEGASIVLTLLQQLGLGVAVLWWVHARYGTLSPLGLRRATWGPADIGVGIGIGAASMFLGGLVIVITQAIVRAITGDTPSPRDTITEFHDGWRIVAMVLAVVVAPWCEEVFFRGFLFGGLRRRFRFVGAAFASGFAFALLHADPIRLAGLTVVGMLFALAFERRRTLAAPIAAHATVNVVAVLLSAAVR
jgi:membrane protease YdiL (CAAX protease family)